jgi:hypothetical protein
MVRRVNALLYDMIMPILLYGDQVFAGDTWPLVGDS